MSIIHSVAPLQPSQRETKELKRAEEPAHEEEVVHMVEGPLFLSTNELGLQDTLSTLQSTPLCGNTIAAPGGLFVLDIASLERISSEGHTTIEHVIAYDNNTKVQIAWERVFIPALQKSSTSQNCAQEIARLIQQNHALLYSKNEIASHKISRDLNTITSQIRNNTSFLSSDERFHRIKTIAMKGKIVFKPLDFFEPKQVERFLQWCDGQNMHLDTLSLSNISECITWGAPESQLSTYKGFHASYESLPKKITLIYALRSPTSMEYARQEVLLSGQRPRIPIMYNVLNNPINDFATIKAMMDYRARFDSVDNFGYTPDKRDEEGITPLRRAMNNGLPDVVAALIENRADIH